MRYATKADLCAKESFTRFFMRLHNRIIPGGTNRRVVNDLTYYFRILHNFTKFDLTDPLILNRRNNRRGPQ